MLFDDDREHEPDAEPDPEPDVEPEVPDPAAEYLGPPEPPMPESEVPEATLKTFWTTVALVNVAVFGIALGAMLAAFRGQLLVGGGAVLVGLLAASHAYWIYRDYDHEAAVEERDESADDG